MDMKKILQAVDGISARPVEGADTMARFLRVVKEAELNQPTAPPFHGTVNSKPYVHAPGPDDPNFERYVYLMWKYEFLDNERTGKGNLIPVNVAVSDESNVEIDRMKYEAEKLAGPNLPAWEKARIGYRTDPEYIKYSQDMAAKMSAELLEDANVASTLSPEQLSYNHLRTQLDYIDAVRDTGGRKNVFVDISPEVAAGEARFRDKLAQLAASLKAKGIDAAAEYDAPEPGEPEAAPVDLNQKYATEQVGIRKFLSIVDKNNVSMLSEGPTDGPAYKYQLTALQQLLTTETEPWKQNLTKWRIANLQQNGVTAFKMDYSKNAQGDFIPTKVVDSDAWVKKNPNLLKRLPRECQPPMVIREGANPHRVTLPVQMAMQHYQQVKEMPPPCERLIDKYFVEAETAIIQRTEEKRALINQYAKTIAERVLMKESAQSVSEAPIAMDPAEPNNPTIHNHQKANTMSLKDRIASARAQLQELAELSESNSLLAWEQICKKAKGGMFMGLEQNLEQIRHGIEELAKQRRKGGTASRGIDKHIGEGKTK